MSRLFGFGSLAGIALVLLVGCGAEKQSEPAAAPAASNHEHGMHDHEMTEEKTEMNEAFADLSPADRQLAEAQKICPVSDQALGSMGTPIKVAVDGRDVFVCCEGCIEELKSDPAKYLAKLDEKP